MMSWDWAPIEETLIPSSHLDQGVQHFLYRRDHARIGGVGILQRQQVRHLLIDVDARRIVESLLQRIEDDVLTLLEIIRRTCGLALLTDELSQIGRDRADEWRG